MCERSSPAGLVLIIIPGLAPHLCVVRGYVFRPDFCHYQVSPTHAVEHSS
jgi:hypothetical protein